MPWAAGLHASVCVDAVAVDRGIAFILGRTVLWAAGLYASAGVDAEQRTVASPHTRSNRALGCWTAYDRLR